MTRRLVSWLWLGLALGLSLFGARSASAQTAAPGDVYYKVHVDQRFKWYVFATDVVTWEAQDLEGTSLAFSASHDTSTVHGSATTSSTFLADGGLFTADLTSTMDIQARTGVWHETFNELAVEVYVRGNTNTQYHLRMDRDGILDASRLGGAPGSLQPVNGSSIPTFCDSTLTVNYGGVASLPVDDVLVRSGFTTTEILVGSERYSLAATYWFRAQGIVMQTVCILGCMTAPATFHMGSVGHVELAIYTQDPTSAPLAAERPSPLAVSAFPNPSRDDTVISFRAPAGQRALVQLFDVRGRLVGGVHDAAATGGTEHVAWRAGGLPAGIYFARVRSGGETSTAKITVRR
ncbi:MAG: T9SS type A sorting domain-containing protein [Candidatus Eiseniibacteriota bacterium]